MATLLTGQFLGFKVLRTKADPTKTFGIIRVDDGENTFEVLTDSAKAGVYDKMESGEEISIPIRMNARLVNGNPVVSVAEVTSLK